MTSHQAETDAAPAWVDGVDVDPNDRWVEAARELRPAKSLARVMGTSRGVLSSVSLVGIALTALGIIGTAAFTAHPMLMAGALGAAVLALAACLLALSYGAGRPEKLNTENLDRVVEWYDRQFRRVWRVTLACWLLMVAVGLGAVVGVAAVVASYSKAPMLTLSEQVSSGQRTLGFEVSITNQVAGSPVTVQVTDSSGRSLFRASGLVDGSGNLVLKGSVPNVADAPEYRLSADFAGHANVVTVSGS